MRALRLILAALVMVVALTACVKESEDRNSYLSLLITTEGGQTTVQDAALINNALTLLKQGQNTTEQEIAELQPVQLVFQPRSGSALAIEVGPTTAKTAEGYLTGPSIQALYTMAIRKLADPGPIVQQVKAAEKVTLEAKDLSLQVDLSSTQREQLVEQIGSLAFIEGVPRGRVPFPSLVLKAQSVPDSVDFFISSGEALSVNGRYYQMPEDLWELLVSWLPPDQSKPSDLTYLFRADSATTTMSPRPITRDDGLFFSVVRLLKEGKLSDLANPPSPPVGEIAFQFGDQLVLVTMGEDWFAYEETIYHRSGLRQDFERLMRG